MGDCLFHVSHGGSLNGTLQVPGDKSISHRALMLGAIAEGTTHIQNFLPGEDPLATLHALRQLGVKILQPEPTEVQITGVGLDGFSLPKQHLDLGNSGTSMRLLTGLLSGQPFNTTLMGDPSLMKRPMARIVEPLRHMGADIDISPNGTAPIQIKGGQSLRGMRYVMPISSAQVKSGILLAGLYAKDDTVIIEKAITRDHTERMLRAFGYPIHVEGNEITLHKNGKLTGQTIEVPGDLSSAAFFILGATIAPNSNITLINVGVNPTRMGVITLLKQMGADIDIDLITTDPEPLANIRVKTAKLHGITIPPEQISLAIDEFPAIFIAAVAASGTTVLRGAKELRFKESDRIATMAEGLQQLGIHTEVFEDGIAIQGGQIRGGEVNSYGDHRIAMAFAMAGLIAKEDIIVHHCKEVATSFPNFIEAAQSLGFDITEHVPILTIDGPSGSGKGTIGRLLAAKLGWHYLDSGAIYRVLALAAIHNNVDIDEERELVDLAQDMEVRFVTEIHGVKVYLNKQDVTQLLATEQCADVASKIAVMPQVRTALLQKQRAFAKAPGLVTDGRDMGTVVFKNATIKLYLHAEAQERAQRRYLQLHQKGIDVSLADILKEIESRDHRDRTRAVAPLRCAEDAIALDTTHLSIEQVVSKILDLVEAVDHN